MPVANELRPPVTTPSRHQADRPQAEPVDLGDPDAVRRALDLHQAGKAVFSVPFNAGGDGSLTWLDPRAREAEAAAKA